MKYLNKFILPIILFCACSTNNKDIPNGIEIIPVEVNRTSRDASSFLEKIELTPLETNDSSLLFKCNKVLYDKSTDMYVIYTSDQLVYTFSGNGKYIDNSKKVKGGGPEEYNMVVDINLNPYLKGIDMLNPYGTIYTYSPTFELLAKRQFKPEFPIDHLMALDSNNYLLTYPCQWTDQEVSFVDFKINQVVNTNYKGTISGNEMGKHCFYHIGKHFYFVPFGLNYFFYKIDTKEKKLVPIIYLDFGDAEVKDDDLPGRSCGKRTGSNEEERVVVKELTERYQFLKKSKNILPILKFFNDDYVYAYLVKTNIGYGDHFIYNRKTKKSYLLKGKEPFLMYPCFAIVDNVLLAICLADRVPKAVDRDFMSSEEIQKMEQLKEDDNPVILKYYLRK